MNFFEFNLRKTAGGKIDQGLKAENNPGLEPNQIFFQKKFQQIHLLEPSFLAKMGRGQQADWATAKILMSI